MCFSGLYSWPARGFLFNKFLILFPDHLPQCLFICLTCKTIVDRLFYTKRPTSGYPNLFWSCCGLAIKLNFLIWLRLTIYLSDTNWKVFWKVFFEGITRKLCIKQNYMNFSFMFDTSGMKLRIYYFESKHFMFLVIQTDL